MGIPPLLRFTLEPWQNNIELTYAAKSEPWPQFCIYDLQPQFRFADPVRASAICQHPANCRPGSHSHYVGGFAH